MSMQTLTWDVDAAAVTGNSDAYSLALASQARQKLETHLNNCSEQAYWSYEITIFFLRKHIDIGTKLFRIAKKIWKTYIPGKPYDSCLSNNMD